MVAVAIFLLNFSVTRRVLINNAQQDLIKTEKNMHRAVQALLSTAINSKGENVLTLLKKSPDGYLAYTWKNPSEKVERLKYGFLEKLEGFELYDRRKDDIDLVLLDMVMPVMDGTACFRQLKRLNPEIRIIIASGYTRDADLGTLTHEGLNGFIRKPHTQEQLSRIIADVLQPSAGGSGSRSGD